MSFTAAYHQEANEAWLNDLLHGIIDPNHRPESRTFSRHTSRNTPTPSNFGDQSQRPTAPRRQSHLSQSTRRSFSPFSWRSPSRGRPSRSRSRTDARTTDVRSPSVYPESTVPQYRNTASPSCRESDVVSVVSSIQPRQSRFEEQRALASPVSAISIPEKTARRLSDARTIVSNGGGGTQTHNLKAIMESPNLSDADSFGAVEDYEDEKLAFAPHPAVRPLGRNEVILGHAAPPDETDDDHQYPGPFALALIIIGICLSVFIISVDRNIVTTVSSILHEPARCPAILMRMTGSSRYHSDVQIVRSSRMVWFGLLSHSIGVSTSLWPGVHVVQHTLDLSCSTCRL